MLQIEINTYCKSAKGLIQTKFLLNKKIGTLALENGKSLTIDCLIWAIGRSPATGNIGLENTDVQLDANGYVITDEQQNTTAKGIYCVGDIPFFI